MTLPFQVKFTVPPTPRCFPLGCTPWGSYRPGPVPRATLCASLSPAQWRQPLPGWRSCPLSPRCVFLPQWHSFSQWDRLQRPRLSDRWRKGWGLMHWHPTPARLCLQWFLFLWWFLTSNLICFSFHVSLPHHILLLARRSPISRCKKEILQVQRGTRTWGEKIYALLK